MNSSNGKRLSGDEHLRQSIVDILTTPKGSRYWRRDYGSDLFKLVDNPLNDVTIAKIYAATVDALLTWENRITPISISMDLSTPAKARLRLEATRTDNGQPITIDGITFGK